MIMFNFYLYVNMIALGKSAIWG